MKKESKKLAAILMAALMAIGCCARGSSSSSSSSTTETQAAEVTADDVVQATGISIEAPEGAADVTYSYFDATDDQEAIAQVAFTLDGNSYIYRAQSTSLLTLSGSADETSSEDEIVSSLTDGAAVCQELADMSGEFDSSATTLVSNREGVVAFTDGKAGYIGWLDAVPGILYVLGMENGASQQLLQDTAEAIFVPVQGED